MVTVRENRKMPPKKELTQKLRQRIGHDAAANDNLIGCAHKISGWPRKSTILLTDPFMCF